MSFATFTYYLEEFKGSVIPNPESFAGAAVEAEAYINLITRGRATEGSEAVKKATCAVAEVIYKQAHDDDAEITSESVGNHSRSFSSKRKSVAEREQEKRRKALLYLSGTGLLYRGMS